MELESALPHSTSSLARLVSPFLPKAFFPLVSGFLKYI